MKKRFDNKLELHILDQSKYNIRDESKRPMRRYKNSNKEVSYGNRYREKFACVRCKKLDKNDRGKEKRKSHGKLTRGSTRLDSM